MGRPAMALAQGFKVGHGLWHVFSLDLIVSGGPLAPPSGLETPFGTRSFGFVSD